MSELKWNAPYMDRRTWILGELDHLNMSAEETLALLLIDYYNEQQQLITHEMIAQKIGSTRHAVYQQFGRSEKLSKEILAKYAQAFGCPLPWLMGEMKKPKEEPEPVSIIRPKPAPRAARSVVRA